MTERNSSQPRGRAMSDAAVDGALAAWPMPERDAMEWDEAAARVEERIESGATPSEISATLTDDDLFAAPLDAERDEARMAEESIPPEQPVSVNSRSARPRRSFKDLAELAKSTPPPVLVEAGVGVEAGVAAAAVIEVEGEMAAAAPVAAAESSWRRCRKRRTSSRSARRRQSSRKRRSGAPPSWRALPQLLALAATIAMYVRTSQHRSDRRARRADAGAYGGQARGTEAFGGCGATRRRDRSDGAPGGERADGTRDDDGDVADGASSYDGSGVDAVGDGVGFDRSGGEHGPFE